MEDLGIIIATIGFCLLSFRFTDYFSYLSKWQKIGLFLLFIGLIVLVFFNNAIDFFKSFFDGIHDGFFYNSN
ncbi:MULTISPECIES: hypothetical protein [Vagococcus]|uniref:Uncharacterized protein n=1 Tax=Vagococcus fluvialis bH819 TaxID=1255619 RepID=A0A1X6WM90_9ENTE|nr:MULTISPECIES: hypothetical protein [Vagococcus]SLM85453.1 hypothetical protein FM121_05095 [Vagococcus fluvialis bH819]HCM89254.1 hypothetical protein [Vagococcus sp.]